MLCEIASTLLNPKKLYRGAQTDVSRVRHSKPDGVSVEHGPVDAIAQ